jgi:hypothetical protein
MVKRISAFRINTGQLGLSAPGDAGRHDEGATHCGNGGDALPEDEEAEEAGPDRLGGVEQRRLRARQALQRRRLQERYTHTPSVRVLRVRLTVEEAAMQATGNRDSDAPAERNTVGHACGGALSFRHVCSCLSAML